jgi:enterochelin esterase-like enzyme
MRTGTFFMLMLLLISCQEPQETFEGHLLQQDKNMLRVKYRGEADVVQFKMFEGRSLILGQKADGVFEGELEIPGLEEAIFSYDILVHEKDSSGKMIQIPYEPIGEENHFRWIGANRDVNFQKADSISGTMTFPSIKSSHLGQNRSLCIYKPSEISATTPIIYFTDGSSVSSYARYVDQLIQEGKIIPIILCGVYASREQRYEEYVNNGIENPVFEQHEAFFFEEIIAEFETSLENWQGKRYLYGVSNGAAFGMHSGINHPDDFEAVIAFSTVDYISELIQPISFEYDNYPQFYMGAGRYEEKTFADNIRFVEKMKNNGISVEFKEFISGHDAYVWQVEFLNYLLDEFKK